MTQQKRNYVLPITMMLASFTMISFVTGLTNPPGLIVKEQSQATNWMTQPGSAANFIAYAFMELPAGMMLKRIGCRKTALTAVAVEFIGVGIQVLSGQMDYQPGELTVSWIYSIGAFVSGLLICMLNAIVNPLLSTPAGGGKEGSQLIQFGGSLNSVSATIVSILSGYLTGTISQDIRISDVNPALFIAMGILVVVFVVSVIMDIPEPHKESASDHKIKNTHNPPSFHYFVLRAVVTFVYVGVRIGIPNFINLLLTASPDAADARGFGMDTAMVGSIVGTCWFLVMTGRLCRGALGAKFSSKTQSTAVSSLVLIFSLIGMSAPSTTTVAMPVPEGGVNIGFGIEIVSIEVIFFTSCSLCTSIVWGSIFNLAVEGLGKYTAVASGIFMVMVRGGSTLPLIQGAVADVTSSYTISCWAIFVTAIYMLYYVLIGYKNVNKDTPVE